MSDKITHIQTVEGTGAAISITCGFKPSLVKIINIDGKASLEHTSSMADASGYKVLTGIDDTADTVSLHSFITSGGVTLTTMGFTIGADTDVNVNGETIHVYAVR
jgi:hypothetical protein